MLSTSEGLSFSMHGLALLIKANLVLHALSSFVHQVTVSHEIAGGVLRPEYCPTMLPPAPEQNIPAVAGVSIATNIHEHAHPPKSQGKIVIDNSLR